MGNGSAKLVSCFTGNTAVSTQKSRQLPDPLSQPVDEGLGHSFCYLRPDPIHHEDPSIFRSISGASVSANTSTPLSTCLDPYTYACHDRACTFKSTTSFASIPLQPIPKNPSHSGSIASSGPLDRGFLSGPIERGFLSGPMGSSQELGRSFSHAGFVTRPRSRKTSLIRGLRRAISKTMPRGQSSIVAPIKCSVSRSRKRNGGDLRFEENTNDLEWAQGKAGEDRVHVVVSEEHGWVFVGIYDGFNGPDAPDYLQSNLYPAVHKELKGLLHGTVKKWRLTDQLSHSNVLKALSKALGKTEKAYLELADNMLFENPELALMGSCVLVMLMKGEDIYVINVGDSRAVLAQKTDSELLKCRSDCDGSNPMASLEAHQLTMDHCTSVEEEVWRIRNEHPDDACAVAMNGRVKGSLKVTRAFGAGFLKQPKWNNALLEMFRIDYVGNSPYITCFPSLYHHRLGPSDRFLILSSDGLYQYFTNEDAVLEIELFVTLCPEGDPAQHLVEELLFRAANKAGMDFHELLEIPQGDRRRYHDDVSIVVVSLEGRIWRSCV